MSLRSGTNLTLQRIKKVEREETVKDINPETLAGRRGKNSKATQSNQVPLVLCLTFIVSNTSLTNAVAPISHVAEGPVNT